MKVYCNTAGGSLYMASATAAVEFESGFNPLNCELFVELKHHINDKGRGRFTVAWYGRHAPVSPDNLLGETVEQATDAVCVISWDCRSLTHDAGSNVVPDIAGENGHMAALGRILNALSQGKMVALQGISAGLLTYISGKVLLVLFSRSHS